MPTGGRKIENGTDAAFVGNAIEQLLPAPHFVAFSVLSVVILHQDRDVGASSPCGS
jgi:hypothetical protein